MPVRPLPKELISRLRRAAKRIDSRLGKMKNIDPRNINLDNTDTKQWGGRVRQMGIARNYRGINLAIKRVHAYEQSKPGNAEQEIRQIRGIVREHNLKYAPKTYKLLMPHAYVIGKDLIAMESITVPTVEEIILDETATAKGRAFFEKLKGRHSVTEAQLIDAYRELSLRTGILSCQIFLLGFSKGKFLFMPLIDVF